MISYWDASIAITFKYAHFSFCFLVFLTVCDLFVLYRLWKYDDNLVPVKPNKTEVVSITGWLVLTYFIFPTCSEVPTTNMAFYRTGTKAVCLFGAIPLFQYSVYSVVENLYDQASEWLLQYLSNKNIANSCTPDKEILDFNLG